MILLQISLGLLVQNALMFFSFFAVSYWHFFSSGMKNRHGGSVLLKLSMKRTLAESKFLRYLELLPNPTFCPPNGEL